MKIVIAEHNTGKTTSILNKMQCLLQKKKPQRILYLVGEVSKSIDVIAFEVKHYLKNNLRYVFEDKLNILLDDNTGSIIYVVEADHSIYKMKKYSPFDFVFFDDAEFIAGFTQFEHYIEEIESLSQENSWITFSPQSAMKRLHDNIDFAISKAEGKFDFISSRKLQKKNESLIKCSPEVCRKCRNVNSLTYVFERKENILSRYLKNLYLGNGEQPHVGNDYCLYSVRTGNKFPINGLNADFEEFVESSNLYVCDSCPFKTEHLIISLNS